MASVRLLVFGRGQLGKQAAFVVHLCVVALPSDSSYPPVSCRQLHSFSNSHGYLMDVSVYYTHTHTSSSAAPFSHTYALSLSLSLSQALTHLINLVGHFPFGCGAAQMTSIVSEFHDAPSLKHLDDLSTEIFDSPRVQVNTGADVKQACSKDT